MQRNNVVSTWQPQVPGNREGCHYAIIPALCVGATLAVARLRDNPTIVRRGDPRGRPALAVAGLLFCLLIYLLPHGVAHAHAASPGVISGQLLNGTKNNAPLAGQSVTLQEAQGSTSKDLANVTTDARGNFVFTNLATDKTISYAVYILYQSAQYTSDLIHLNDKPAQQVSLTVYEATSSTANIAVVQATILVHKPDAQKGIMSVSEFFIFKNLDTTHTYVGSLDASHGKPNALRFSLPHGAGNISLSSGFDGYKSIAVPGGFATDAALLPGISQFAFAFEIPYSATEYDFDNTIVYPTVQISFMVPTSLHASSDVLTAQGVMTADQLPYFLFQGKQLLAGRQFHTALEGLPQVATKSSTPSTSSQLVFWLIAGALIMLAGLLVTVFFYRFTHRATPAKKSAKQSPRQQQRKERIEPKEVATQTKKDTTKDRQQALLQELLVLDKAFEAGKLKKSGYEEQRTALKAQLRTLMSDTPIVKSDTDEKPARKTTKTPTIQKEECR